MKSRDNYYFKQSTRTREQNILNLSYGQFESDNDMGIPIIKNQNISISEIDNSKLIGFNFAKTAKETKTKGLHFFLHDYQFERVWNFPTRYLEILKNYKYILSLIFHLMQIHQKLYKYLIYIEIVGVGGIGRKMELK